jgi:hypothetical protein
MVDPRKLRARRVARHFCLYFILGLLFIINKYTFTHKLSKVKVNNNNYFLILEFLLCLNFAKDNIIADDKIANIMINESKTGIL